MWNALPFAVSVAVAAGNVYYDWTSNFFAVATLVLAGAAISIGLAASMRSAGQRRREVSDTGADPGERAPSGMDSISPRR